MKGVIALAGVVVMLGTALPSVALARAGGGQTTTTATTTTSGGKVQASPTLKARPKPKEKPKAKAKPNAKPAVKDKVKDKKDKKTTTKPATAIAGTTNNASITGTGSVTAATPTIPPVRNQSLEARLQPLLPSGMSVSDASKGFRNWGRFVAAVHASQNLNIPFQSLKLKMTGDMPLSLGQAIHAIRSGAITPTAMVIHNRTTTASAVTQAEQQAAEDFRYVRDDNR